MGSVTSCLKGSKTDDIGSLLTVGSTSRPDSVAAGRRESTVSEQQGPLASGSGSDYNRQGGQATVHDRPGEHQPSISGHTAFERLGGQQMSTATVQDCPTDHQPSISGHNTFHDMLGDNQPPTSGHTAFERLRGQQTSTASAFNRRGRTPASSLATNWHTGVGPETSANIAVNNECQISSSATLERLLGRQWASTSTAIDRLGGLPAATSVTLDRQGRPRASSSAAIDHLGMPQISTFNRQVGRPQASTSRPTEINHLVGPQASTSTTIDLLGPQASTSTALDLLGGPISSTSNYSIDHDRMGPRMSSSTAIRLGIYEATNEDDEDYGGVQYPRPNSPCPVSLLSEEEQVKIVTRMGLIEHLPTRIYDGCGSNHECVICIGEFVEGDQVCLLPCMHLFHKKCIDDWLIRSFTCPTCIDSVDASLLSNFINPQNNN